MTALLMLAVLLAAPVPSSLEQVQAESNPDRRARVAIDYAAVAERSAEAAYAKGDMHAMEGELKNAQQSLQTAKEALVASGKTPGRNPGPYKYAELHSRDLLIRLGDLEQRMDISDRGALEPVKVKIQEIHDAWFEGIMGRKR
jgi:hypothetical protein